MLLQLFFLLCLHSPPAAEGATIYVKADATGGNNGASWTDAYTDFQAALAVAVNGDEIWVAKGIYTPTADADSTESFELKSGVALYGGFIGTETLRDERDWRNNKTILTGDIDGNDTKDVDGVTTEINGNNSYHVVKAGTGVTATAVVDGFIITGGNANGIDLKEKSGGGMYILDSTHVEVRTCTFTGNGATFGGGGMYNDNSSSLVADCTFSNNFAIGGGGMYNDQSDPTVRNCTFSNNDGGGANGGGMYNDQSNPTVTNCTFSKNDGGGYGGGMYNNASSPVVTNCTFLGNIAGANGCGMHSSSGGGESNPVVVNCIFWGDESEVDQIGGPLTITYSITTVVAEGNRNAAPLLAALADNGGPTKTHALPDDSPARSAGLAAGTVVSGDIEVPATDQRGVPRPAAPVLVDIGAYQSQGAPSPVTGVVVEPKSIMLYPGESGTLSATVSPMNADDSSVLWTSSNPAVAAVSTETNAMAAIGVSYARVQGLVPGIATITSRTRDGGFADTSLVTALTPVTRVELDPSEISIQPGESMVMTARVFPSDADDTSLQWHISGWQGATMQPISNTSVRINTSLDYFNVKGPGLVTVNVRTNNGGFTAKSLISVDKEKESPIPVRNIIVSPGFIDIIGRGIYQGVIKAEIYPENASNKLVAWSVLPEEFKDRLSYYTSDTGLRCYVTVPPFKELEMLRLEARTVDGGFTDYVRFQYIEISSPACGGGSVLPFSPSFLWLLLPLALMFRRHK